MDQVLFTESRHALHALHSLTLRPCFSRCEGTEHKNHGRFSSNGFGATCRLSTGNDCIALKKQKILDLINFRQQQERENATFFHSVRTVKKANLTVLPAGLWILAPFTPHSPLTLYFRLA